jgi:ABC-type glycerol-3-phosphate transport system permease component
MLKAIVSLIVAVIAISPLVASMIESAQLGGTYITEKTYRYFPPDIRHEKYPAAAETISFLNSLAKTLLALMALFIFIMTAAEYWKFYKIYKEEGDKH